MEWVVPVNDMLREIITKITHTLLPPGFRGDMRTTRVMQESLAKVIDALGEQSAAAQGLKNVITTAEKLRNSPSYTLYLFKDPEAKGGAGEVVALLKVGTKRLFLFDERGVVREVEALCVLDFYVRADRQRHGLGKQLFDHMLQEENAKVENLAIDGPSPKMEQFLRSNYGVERLIRQSNNFAVSPLFFSSEHSTSGRSTPALAGTPARGRFSAPHPPSVVGSVIHGGGNSGYYQENSRGSSGSNTPDLIGESTPEPEFSIARPISSRPEAAPGPSRERPTTLQVEANETPLQAGRQEHRDGASLTAAGSAQPRRDSQLTTRGYVDVKFYHSKLW